MATKKRMNKKKTAKKTGKPSKSNVPLKAVDQMPKLPKPVKCEGPVIRERNGVKYEAYLLPETDIEVPAELKDHVYEIESVHPDPTNPRNTKNLDVLIASINRFGFRVPFIVNRFNLEMEAGHKRREALKRLGCRFAPMTFVFDDETRQMAYNIADNRTAEIVAEWDEDALSKIYGNLREKDALEGVGFDDDSMIAVINDLKEQERLERQRQREEGGGEGGGGEGGGGGDGGKDIGDQYLITIKCKTEGEQVRLLEFLNEHEIDASASII